MSNQYNLYRVEARDHGSLVEHLKDADFKETGITKEIEGFRLTFYVCKEAPKEPTWKGLYRHFIPESLQLSNQIHSAALVIRNSDHCFVVAMGRAFHAIKKVADKEFGLNLAERIVDESEIKQKASNFFQSKRNKSIQSFVKDNPFSYDSGESIAYLKARTMDKNVWGNRAEFGMSFRFSSERDPGRLPELIRKIISLLTEKGAFSFPRTEKVNNSEMLIKLDRLLTEQLLKDGEDPNGQVEFEDFELQGCDFSFTSAKQFFLYVYGQKNQTKMPLVQLELALLRDFVEELELDPHDILRSVRVEVQSETGSPLQMKVKELLDTVIETEENSYCLLEGDWFEFSKSYLEYLNELIDRMAFENVREYDFTKRKVRRKDGEKIEGHDEDWFLKEVTARDAGFVEFHKESFSAQMKNLKQRHNVELMDLYKDRTLFVVKRGGPQKLAYAIDQAIASVNFLKEMRMKFRYKDKYYRPQEVCVWLLMSRRPIESLSEIKSTIFKMKLIEFRRVAQDAGLTPIIWISYERKANPDA